MTTETYTPSVRELDSQSKDYAARLDAGIAKLRERGVVLSKRLRGLDAERGERLASLLKENGIHPAGYHELVYQQKDGENGAVRESQRVRAIRVSVNNVDETRKIEDVLDLFDQMSRNDFEELRQEHKVLRRALEDYFDAALNLTTLQPVGEADPEYATAHFFVVRPDGVYGAHLDLRSGKESGPMKIPDIDPKVFEKKNGESVSAEVRDEMNRLTERGTTVDANLYVVQNPVNEIPVEIISAHVAASVYEYLAEARQQRVVDERERSSLGRKLLDPVVFAIKGFNGAQKKQ